MENNIIYHVIGIEGCGHHGLDQIFIEILQMDELYVDRIMLDTIIANTSRNCDSIEYFETEMKKIF